ncbi:MAG: acetate--CoA ligase family protein [Caldiserica bacterium]|jgi:acyl-CoA synthetase (NDP forming)|nr:acetate--CoA ligase family protein [Caldisericota bacterium]
MNGKFLTEPECYQLMAESGLPVPRFAFCPNKEAAVEKSREIGYPIVMKIVSPQIIHKSDVGGVRVNLKSDKEAGLAYESITSKIAEKCPDALIQGVLVMPYFSGGQELIVGGLKDEQFGSTLMFGLGGVFTEILKDVSFRICPFDKREAMKMVREIKGFPLLSGYRGGPRLDIESLTDFLSQFSRFLFEKPQIKEIDLNPVFLFNQGLSIADCRILLENEERRNK